MAIDWQPLGKIIQDNHRFVLTSHVRPDADALGSELAMASMLESVGKDVRIVNPSAAPDNLAFMDPSGRVQKLGDQITADAVMDTDVHMVLDTSAWTQLSAMGPVLRKTSAVRVVIDHHVSSDNLQAIEFKDPLAEATGTLIHELAMALKLPVTRDTANSLYCAIATDTGWFRFPSTRAATMRVIADLMERGAEPHVLYASLYEQRSLSRLHLAGRVLSRVKVDCDGQLAYTIVELKDLTATGASPVDTEGLVNECLAVRGTRAAFIASEQRNGMIKISLRSRPGVDVSQLAEVLGGGGHKQASGITLPGPLRVAAGRVLAAFRSFFENEAAAESSSN